MSRLPLTPKQRFLRACRCQEVDRVPVWLMRQAGRYLPEYQELRRKHSFLEVCRTPELAAEVSLQPYRRLGVDVVIVFSDILIVAAAMGLPLEINDSGPVLQNPIRDAAAIQSLKEFDPEKDTRFVGDAVRHLCRELGPDVPVLGFAAAPWTLACYMVEGQTSGAMSHLKGLLRAQPALLHELLRKIAGVTTRYLEAQIAAGAAAVQLFDTWAGELARDEFEEFELPAIQKIAQALAPARAPVIYFLKGAAHLLPVLPRTGAHVLSVDWQVDLAEARRAFGPAIALQGNADPASLLATEKEARAAARKAVEATGGAGHILNLGHGILPTTPVANALAFVREGQSISVGSEAAEARAESLP